MNEHLFPFHEEIKRETQLGEAVEDIAKMVEIITMARQERTKGSFEKHVVVALVTMCARPYPGKPPSYRKEIRNFRLKFAGISNNPLMQLVFLNSLRISLLTYSLKKLDFSSIDRLFIDEGKQSKPPTHSPPKKFPPPPSPWLTT